MFYLNEEFHYSALLIATVVTSLSWHESTSTAKDKYDYRIQRQNETAFVM